MAHTSPPSSSSHTMIERIRLRLDHARCPHRTWAEIEDGVSTITTPDHRRGRDVEVRLARVAYRCLGCGKEQTERPDLVSFTVPYTDEG